MPEGYYETPRGRARTAREGGDLTIIAYGGGVETALAAAIRETQEEVGVTPTGLEEIGELYFQFLDGYKLHVAVFAADDCHGELCETPEATPL